jgi:hypothetical protein
MITSVTLVFRALSVYCAENDAYDRGVIVDEYAQLCIRAARTSRLTYLTLA